MKATEDMKMPKGKRPRPPAPRPYTARPGGKTYLVRRPVDEQDAGIFTSMGDGCYWHRPTFND